jgi:hypothetical protein
LILTGAAYGAREAQIFERSDQESGLSGTLNLLKSKSDLPELHPEIFTKLEDVTERVRVAIAIHIEAVAATKALREKLVFRFFRLAGSAPLPIKYAFEDDLL